MSYQGSVEKHFSLSFFFFLLCLFYMRNCSCSVRLRRTSLVHGRPRVTVFPHEGAVTAWCSQHVRPLPFITCAMSSNTESRAPITHMFGLTLKEKVDLCLSSWPLPALCTCCGAARHFIAQSLPRLTSRLCTIMWLSCQVTTSDESFIFLWILSVNLIGLVNLFSQQPYC